MTIRFCILKTILEFMQISSVFRKTIKKVGGVFYLVFQALLALNTKQTYHLRP